MSSTLVTIWETIDGLLSSAGPLWSAELHALTRRHRTMWDWFMSPSNSEVTLLSVNGQFLPLSILPRFSDPPPL